MFAIAAVFRADPARRLTFVPAVGGLAMVLVTLGGGVLGLVAWLGLGVILIGERLSSRDSRLRPDAPQANPSDPPAGRILGRTAGDRGMYKRKRSPGMVARRLCSRDEAAPRGVAFASY